MAGYTLVDYAQTHKGNIRGSVANTLLKESDALQMVPFETIGDLSSTIVRIKDLPSVTFREINGQFTESDGHLEQKVETIAVMGLFSDVDKLIVEAKKNAIISPRAIQQTMMTEAMAYNFNDKWINGDPDSAGNRLEFKGLRPRIDDLNDEGFTKQFIDNGGTTGDGILLNSAERQNFMDSMDKLHYALRGHKPDADFMNRDMLLAMRSAFRREGVLDTTKDMFDRVVTMWDGVRLVDVGTTADQTTEIITSTETLEAAGSPESTSIYAVQFEIGMKFWGIQTTPMNVTDHGLLQTQPQFRTEIEWALGMANIDPYSIARLKGIIPDASN